MNKIKLGFVPTRRSIFSAPDALKYRGLTADRLRDERPEPDGTRLRDSQCGLFATGKVLRRFQVPFTYMTNCRLTDPEFESGWLIAGFCPRRWNHVCGSGSFAPVILLRVLLGCRS